VTEGVFDRDSGHEQVVFCQDPPTGLRAIIAVHSTVLGPALGGVRFHPYGSEQHALDDALALSAGMSYKNALAQLDLGGGKAVIIGDPAAKSEALLRAYGRFVQSLGGRYITACDVGTNVGDMDLIARESEFVVGRSADSGGADDPSGLTAYGVYLGMRAAAEHVWGTTELRGRTVGVAGVGKVGRILVGHLVDAGARVVVTDVSESAVQRVRAQHAELEVAADTAALVASDLDVYAPCALGGALSEEVAETLRATVVCGSANNQLTHAGVGRRLHERGIWFAPDYLVNSGGVIQVSEERHGFDHQRATRRVEAIFDSTGDVFALADREAVPPVTAAGRLAERRMTDIGRLRGIMTS